MSFFKKIFGKVFDSVENIEIINVENTESAIVSNDFEATTWSDYYKLAMSFNTFLMAKDGLLKGTPSTQLKSVFESSRASLKETLIKLNLKKDVDLLSLNDDLTLLFLEPNKETKKLLYRIGTLTIVFFSGHIFDEKYQKEFIYSFQSLELPEDIVKRYLNDSKENKSFEGLEIFEKSLSPILQIRKI